MEVTRNVILDLLPLYLAGETSADTQALVKNYLKHDPDLAQLAWQWQERLPEPPPSPVRPDAQALAYLEAKRQMEIRTIGLAAAIAAGLIAVIAMVSFFVYSSPP
jgi:hypothetical protein